MLEEGYKICVLDNQVLDLDLLDHPGGNYIIPLLTGRDVTKYFNGAFGLDNLPAHIHSNQARELVNSISIASFSTTTPPINHCTISTSKPLTDQTSLFTFTLLSPISSLLLPLTCFKPYYPNLCDLGKHFLVSTTKNSEVKRQYTICNAMREPAYEWVLKEVKEFAE